MTLRLGIILLPLVAPAMLLPLAACDHKDFTDSANRVEAVLRGDPPPDAGMYMAEIPASSEEAVAAVEADPGEVVEPLAMVEPESPPSEVCHVTAFRDFFIDCHGFNVEGPER